MHPFPLVEFIPAFDTKSKHQARPPSSDHSRGETHRSQKNLQMRIINFLCVWPLEGRFREFVFFNLSQAMPHGSATATHKHCAPAHMVLLFVSFCTMTVQVDAEVAKGLEEMARRGGKWTRSDGIPYFGKEREPQVHSARSEHPPKGCSFVTLFVSKRALMVPSCAIFSFTHTHTHTHTFTHTHSHIHTFTRQPLSRFVVSGRDSEHPVMSGRLGALRSRPSQQSTVAFRT